MVPQMGVGRPTCVVTGVCSIKAAKDAQIAELLEFVRNFHNYTHIGDYIWIDLLNDADQILAKYPE